MTTALDKTGYRELSRKYDRGPTDDQNVQQCINWREHQANRHSHLSPVAVPLLTELGRHLSVAQRLSRGLSMILAESEPELYEHDKHLHPLG